MVSDRRARKGRELLDRHAALLAQVSETYGVQARFIVALWGIETDFGRITGGFPVIASLATLAHDGRRSAFFRKELMLALEIIDQGHIDVEGMIGSWAGAMGQNQFMPSSYHAYAVDHDGDGEKNIWGSLPDVFASTANYLARSGWSDDATWGRQVRLPAGFSGDLVGRKTVKDWPTGSVWESAGRTARPARPEPSCLDPDPAVGQHGSGLRGLRELRGDPQVEPVELLRHRRRDSGRPARTVARETGGQ